jgi:SAM-dependent methyltransferase
MTAASVPDSSGSPGVRQGGYDPASFDHLVRVEDRHFWFRARNRLLFALSKRLVASLPPGYRVLEAGCGSGNVLRFIERACTAGTVIGVDFRMEGLRHARARCSCPLVNADVRTPPFAAGFDLIGIFDVLEHLPDDLDALRDLKALLNPGGRLLLTVPAHQSLWSCSDETALHCRRYSSNEMHRKLTAAGYTVEFLTEFMACIFPLLWLSRRLMNLRVKNAGRAEAFEVALGEFRVVPLMNPLLNLLLNLEARWVSGGRRLPFGASLLAVARNG